MGRAKGRGLWRSKKRNRLENCKTNQSKSPIKKENKIMANDKIKGIFAIIVIILGMCGLILYLLSYTQKISKNGNKINCVWPFD